MKKRILIISAMVLCAAVTVAVCSEQQCENAVDETMCTDVILETDAWEDFSEELSVESEKNETDIHKISIDSIFSEDILCGFIDSMGMYLTADEEADQENEVKYRFVRVAEEFGMTVGEIRSIAQMMTQNCDLGLVLDVYEFLRYSELDMDLLKDLYEAGSEKSDSRFWVYNTYDKMYEREDDMLSVEDIAYYVNKGISTEEIMNIYGLSFSSEKSTKEMIEERINGASWIEITGEDVFGSDWQNDIYEELELEEIAEIRDIAVKQRKAVSEIIDVKFSKAVISDEAKAIEEAIEEKTASIMRKCNIEIGVKKSRDMEDRTIPGNMQPIELEK